MKDDISGIIENRQNKKHQMVLESHMRNRENGVFENMNQIFQRLPIPRLQKSKYKFIFDKVKDDVESFLRQENKIQIMKQKQQQSIDKIDVKLSRVIKSQKNREEEENKQSEKMNLLMKQNLRSNSPLFRTLIYLRRQDDLGLKIVVGENHPFLGDEHLIDLQKVKSNISNIKLFLEGSAPLKRHKLQFINENEIKFKNKSFPSTYEIEKRAQVLAKLYLLNLFKQEGRQLKLLDKQDEKQMQKKREINKIKQQSQIQKIKDGELIEERDLISQVHNILALIEKKMNFQAYEEFRNKKGQRATAIKQSLEKLKDHVQKQQNPTAKLKYLIMYKYKKGW